jgi:hypothetical protein
VVPIKQEVQKARKEMQSPASNVADAFGKSAGMDAVAIGCDALFMIVYFHSNTSPCTPGSV